MCLYVILWPKFFRGFFSRMGPYWNYLLRLLPLYQRGAIPPPPSPPRFWQIIGATGRRQRRFATLLLAHPVLGSYWRHWEWVISRYVLLASFKFQHRGFNNLFLYIANIENVNCEKFINRMNHKPTSPACI